MIFRTAGLFALLSGFLFLSCTPGRVLKLSKTQNVFFLDSTAASFAIVDDDTEGYFEKVNVLDMSLQMKTNYPALTDRKIVLADYRTFLKKDVDSFNGKEKKLLKDAVKKAYRNCNKMHPDIFPTSLELVKTHGKHYGSGAYYTRENRIIIPADALDLEKMDKKSVEQKVYTTILHELFHIYSRYNPKKRRQLYALLGFKNIFGMPYLMSDPLKERLLLNPDGLDIGQVIDLKTDSSTISAIPITFSRQTQFDPAKPDFFDYLDFALYQVVRKGSAIKVVCKDDGSSTLELKNLPGFFSQIKDNTSYIIHPDEIMAENFILLITNSKINRAGKELSSEGRELLEEMKKIITE